MRRLEGKVALVTGAARGLGLDIVGRFVAEGAAVVLAARAGRGGEDAAAAAGADFEPLDVIDEAQWRAAIAAVERRHGRLDILVNNAGLSAGEVHFDPEDTLIEDWRATFAVNVEGVFLGCKHGIPALRRAGGGSIINMSSIAALLCTPFVTAYGASKAAVVHLTRSVAQHCAQQKYAIRCNALSPGEVPTQMMTSHWEKLSRADGSSVEDLRDRYLAMIPMGAFQEAVDMSSGAVFLASDESRFITGQNMVIDGGVTLR